MEKSKQLIGGIILGSLIFAGNLLGQQPAAKAQQKQSSPQATQERPDVGKILMKGLRETSGCLGVKTCQWDDGKQSIVAWFEDKDAAEAWYFSATHQAMMGGKTDGYDAKKVPMKHVENNGKPIMVIASLTPSDKPRLPNIRMPISQISIELFQPLPGGAQVGGRVTPKEIKIPHMRNYSDEKTVTESKEK